MGAEHSDRYVKIGRIGKARGLHGVVRIIPDSPDFSELLEHNALFYTKQDPLGFIPIRVEEVQTEFKRNQTSFFVKFDRITNRSDAEKVLEKTLWCDQNRIPLLQKTTDDTLVGYQVFNNQAWFGEVLEVLENPAHPILEVKTERDIILIPMVEFYISETNHSRKSIQGINLDLLSEI